MRRYFSATLAIAITTFLESIRNRILVVAVMFGVALVGFSVTLAAVSMGERARLIVDVGLAAASAMGSLMAVALMIISFGRELERHSAYPVLARPLPRSAFVLGKYIGVLTTMVMIVLLLLFATALAVWMYGDKLPQAFAASIWLACLEMIVVTALSLLFSCFASPVFAATYSITVVVAGNFTNDIVLLADKLIDSSPIFSWFLYAAHAVLPDLQALSLRLQAANNLAVPAAFTFFATVYAFAYASCALVLAIILFARRKAI
ncbi:MAG: hypothetical protein JW841_18220 [Deltaproteobacteria bacterium]|nr:hypothetical protein [Deltaproteobacteria bacterium]